MFGHVVTLQQGIDENKPIITGLLAACGPQEFWQVAKECSIQAQGNLDMVSGALHELLHTNAIVESWEDGIDGEDGFLVYDLVY